ncbi:hypothetical protein FN846DRAFT_893381 [Sphaerosporella brunnea]|uniref:Uncharacterized protein n=1 Tax=Sphaerosporella brunnea TaxID=1250544 RepID=A0A5J5EMM3_9PEZI|nr:hypothetical protein FN846DRAFT_893381 [Sphaerosporella brunnea]
MFWRRSCFSLAAKSVVSCNIASKKLWHSVRSNGLQGLKRLGEGLGASRAGITSPPFPPASPPTPHDTQAKYTQFRGYTACQGLGALEYDFLAWCVRSGSQTLLSYAESILS